MDGAWLGGVDEMMLRIMSDPCPAPRDSNSNPYRLLARYRGAGDLARMTGGGNVVPISDSGRARQRTLRPVLLPRERRVDRQRGLARRAEAGGHVLVRAARRWDDMHQVGAAGEIGEVRFSVGVGNCGA